MCSQWYVKRKKIKVHIKGFTFKHQHPYQSHTCAHTCTHICKCIEKNLEINQHLAITLTKILHYGYFPFSLLILLLFPIFSTMSITILIKRLCLTWVHLALSFTTLRNGEWHHFVQTSLKTHEWHENKYIQSQTIFL